MNDNDEYFSKFQSHIHKNFTQIERTEKYWNNGTF